MLTPYKNEAEIIKDLKYMIHIIEFIYPGKFGTQSQHLKLWIKHIGRKLEATSEYQEELKKDEKELR